MSGPAGEQDKIPPGIIPYVMAARQEGGLSGHVVAVLAGVVFSQIAANVADRVVRDQLSQAGHAFIRTAIDDCATPPLPWPPHHFGSLEAAAQVGALALASKNPAMRQSLAAAARELSARGLAELGSNPMPA